MNVLGIDPGKDGAVVLLEASTRRVLHVELTRIGFLIGKEYSDDLMAARLEELVRELGIGLAVLERQHAMPKQGGTSMFSVGLGFGLWRGLLAAMRIPREFVRAVDWQKALCSGQGGDPKTRSVLVAQRSIPALNLKPDRCRQPQQGIADAACMALYGIGRLPKAEHIGWKTMEEFA